MSFKKETNNTSVFSRIKKAIKNAGDDLNEFLDIRGSHSKLNGYVGQRPEELYTPSADEIVAEPAEHILSKKGREDRS